jgi:hypothetical protein
VIVAYYPLYFHGGVCVLGDAFQAADLASQVGRRTRESGHALIRTRNPAP